MPRHCIKVSHTCEACGKEFLVKPSDVKHGRGRFCSRTCTRVNMPTDPLPLPVGLRVPDYTGMRFGNLEVLYFIGVHTERNYWRVRCDCGRLSHASGNALRSGRATTCQEAGCSAHAVDISGQTFDTWEVIGRAGSDRQNRATWRCRCTRCGQEDVLRGALLRENGRGRKCQSEACRREWALNVDADGAVCCIHCGRSFPFDTEHFRNNPSAISKMTRVCRECAREMTRKVKARNRLKVLSYYSRGTPGCFCCGEAALEFLTIDHVNGDGAEHRRSVGASYLYLWLIKHKYPDGFRVLCMNCNHALGIYGYCPHNPLVMRQQCARKGALRTGTIYRI